MMTPQIDGYDLESLSLAKDVNILRNAKSGQIDEVTCPGKSLHLLRISDSELLVNMNGLILRFFADEDLLYTSTYGHRGPGLTDEDGA